MYCNSFPSPSKVFVKQDQKKHVCMFTCLVWQKSLVPLGVASPHLSPAATKELAEPTERQNNIVKFVKIVLILINFNFLYFNFN